MLLLTGGALCALEEALCAPEDAAEDGALTDAEDEGIPELEEAGCGVEVPGAEEDATAAEDPDNAVEDAAASLVPEVAAEDENERASPDDVDRTSPPRSPAACTRPAP